MIDVLMAVAVTAGPAHTGPTALLAGTDVAAGADTPGAWLVPAAVAVPLVAAVAVLALARFGEWLAGVLGFLAAVLTCVLSVLVVVADRLDFDHAWIPALGVRLHLGTDAVSEPLVLLTGVLGVLATGYLLRVRPVGDAGAPATGPRLNGMVACVLVVVGGAMATFTALDAVVFYIAFEVVLVPMWFLIAFWGDPSDLVARRDAANRFILFTAVGSALMLLGLLLVGLRQGTFDLTELAALHGQGLDRTVQVVAASLMVLGLAVKTPCFPLHTWLPAAHTKAPTVGSVLLAGVLLKMGTYGLVRVVLPVVPEGLEAVAPVLGAFAVAGIFWGSLACLAERDLKRLVAFSSVAHMGFVLLGIASMTPLGVQGALFGNIAHGVISALLFFVAGGIKDRHHTADLAAVGPGLRVRAPRLGWLLAFGAVAGLGLPGLAGFWGEMLAVAGAWQAGTAFGPLARWLSVLAGVGTVLASAYLLRVLREVWQGRAGDAHLAEVPDATWRERLVSWPLVAAAVGLGLVPGPVLNLTADTVRTLLGVQGQ